MSLWIFVNTFSSREKAFSLWLLIFLTIMLFKESIRKSIYEVIKSFFHIKVFSIFVGMLIYIALVIKFLYKIGLWEFSLTKDTIFWILGTAFVFLINTNKATQNINYFKNVVLDSFKFIVVLEFIINFYTYNFWIEIILIPILTILSLGNSLAGTKPEYKQVKKFLDSILAIFGIYLTIYIIGKVVIDYKSLINTYNLVTFILPILLTITLIPYLYLFALAMAYETLFIRLGIFIKKEELLNYSKKKIFFLCHLNLSKLNRLAHNRMINQVSNKKDLKRIINNFKAYEIEAVSK